MRHTGWLFVVFVLALLLERGAAVRTGWRRWLLVGIVGVQAVCGVYAAAVSVAVPFAPSRAVVAYLRVQHLDSAPLVFAPGVVGQAVLAYLERPAAWYPERHGEGSYVVWNYALLAGAHMPTAAELQGLARGKDGVVLITDRRLSAAECVQLGVAEAAAFTEGIASSESPYFVYRRGPAASNER
jgi:hypothetical protein